MRVQIVIAAANRRSGTRHPLRARLWRAAGRARCLWTTTGSPAFAPSYSATYHAVLVVITTSTAW
ncbi:hypothetical protein [Janibacter melonis]|uniref:hypothetical protein n=1 Tax=Janibacter melonis TaxID=262209 RepID=UPI0017848B98